MIIFDPSLKIFSPTLLNDESIFCGFGTKFTGNAKNIENIFDFINDSGVKYDKIITQEQIHSANVTEVGIVNSEKMEKIPETDGLVTARQGFFITAVTADCSPMIFADRERGITGISHQGWRGTLKKLPVKMIGKMVEIGAKKDSIFVAIGPAINDCCYDVDYDRFSEFSEEFGRHSEEIFRQKGGRYFLNLNRLNYIQLIESGIPEKNIDHFPFCTKCDRERFFSFRRRSARDFGEMFSFIISNKTADTIY